MTLRLHTPSVAELGEVVAALRRWQQDDAPMQLHPGDIGWFWQFGIDQTAAALRVWRRGTEIVAIGMLDEPDLLRMTTAPDLLHDEATADAVAADLVDPTRGVLPTGAVGVEAPTGALIHDRLAPAGWGTDDPWAPLSRDLRDPVEDAGLRIVEVGPGQRDERIAVHHSAFDSTRFTRAHWSAMESGVPYTAARSLLGYNEHDTAVAMVTCWSAGPGKPGILEPMGVHQDHRGHGHGRAISIAAAAALRELGSSSAQVCTPASNVGAVATYVAAGFAELPLRRDSIRPA